MISRKLIKVVLSTALILVLFSTAVLATNPDVYAQYSAYASSQRYNGSVLEKSYSTSAKSKTSSDITASARYFNYDTGAYTAIGPFITLNMQSYTTISSTWVATKLNTAPVALAKIGNSTEAHWF